jgi:hypothetical protein
MVSLEFCFLGIILPTCNISFGGRSKGGRCIRLTTLTPSCADCLETWEPQTSWNPQGPSRDYFPLITVMSPCGTPSSDYNISYIEAISELLNYVTPNLVPGVIHQTLPTTIARCYDEFYLRESIVIENRR